ncbi:MULTISPECIES: hypothetical protein [unclassified Crossiella]|uniref:hypothetical protein n=1 Tax=unclassified Crossiella TaxID=2620835 RepID=UPI001FFFCBEF|nr:MULTISPECIES: hypothetical protein [unclassified Crossiella]MCK2240873.1 hypothetical protein [Crossiella sp. S99.2]MCK2253983.1 hypothetical protein [Crossiella sp. S99.1]
MPLDSWSCDACGKPITSAPNDGIVVWRTRETDGRYLDHDFKIVHKTIEPDPVPHRCDPGNAGGYDAHIDLTVLLGADGLAWLLSWLSAGPFLGGGHLQVADLDEYVNLVRRLQTPYYEQARQNFNDEAVRDILCDASEVAPYLPDTLHRIAAGTLGK